MTSRKKIEKLDAIEKKIETLDSRLFDFTMRVLTIMNVMPNVALGRSKTGFPARLSSI